MLRQCLVLTSQIGPRCKASITITAVFQCPRDSNTLKISFSTFCTNNVALEYIDVRILEFDIHLILFFGRHNPNNARIANAIISNHSFTPVTHRLLRVLVLKWPFVLIFPKLGFAEFESKQCLLEQAPPELGYPKQSSSRLSLPLFILFSFRPHSLLFVHLKIMLGF